MPVENCRSRESLKLLLRLKLRFKNNYLQMPPASLEALPVVAKTARIETVPFVDKFFIRYVSTMAKWSWLKQRNFPPLWRAYIGNFHSYRLRTGLQDLVISNCPNAGLPLHSRQLQPRHHPCVDRKLQDVGAQ